MPDGLSRPMERAIVTLPNAISFARLCAVPLAVWLVVRGDWRWAFWLFGGAAASDGLDGWLARRGAGSRLGAVLDPLADKLLLVSMFVVLAAVRRLPDWLAILVVFRDVLIVGGIVLITTLGFSVEIAPLRISKLNTALQLGLVALVLLGAGFGWRWGWLSAWVIWCAAATTLVSGALYVAQGVGAARAADG